MHGVNNINQKIKTYSLNLFGVRVTEWAGDDDKFLQFKGRISAVTAFKCPI